MPQCRIVLSVILCLTPLATRRYTDKSPSGSIVTVRDLAGSHDPLARQMIIAWLDAIDGLSPFRVAVGCRLHECAAVRQL